MLVSNPGCARFNPHASVTYIDVRTDPAPSNPHTFTSSSIGTAAVDRFVVVAVMFVDNAAGSASVTGVTIAGDAMTALHSQATAGDKHNISFWGRTVTSGTTADIVVTTSEAADGLAIAIWNANGLLSTTVRDTGGSSTGSAAMSDTILAPAGGVVIAAGSAEDSTGTYTWSGITERFDEIHDAGSDSWSGASSAFATQDTALTVTCTPSSTNAQQCMAIIALR